MKFTGTKDYVATDDLKVATATQETLAAKLCELFDAVPEGRPIVVLAHCGPSGLGDTRAAIFGCDFRPDAGDLNSRHPFF